MKEGFPLSLIKLDMRRIYFTSTYNAVRDINDKGCDNKKCNNKVPSVEITNGHPNWQHK